MEYINRHISDLVKNLGENQSPVIMLTGARQVGKSTLLKMLFSDNINYVSLDNIDDRKLAIEDPKLFFEKYKWPLVIDEFQYAPNITSYIKIIVDEERFKSTEKNKKNPTGMFYLTGSQRFLAMKNLRESLAGRVSILDLYGLSTREINNDDYRIFEPNVKLLLNEKIKSKKLSVSEIYNRIWLGSFPEMYAEKVDRNLFFKSYIETYINRDVKDLLKIKDDISFYNFLTVMAARTACELNLQEISEEVGVSQVTIKEWINVLWGSGIIMLLPTYSTNIIKRVVKRPKIHFLDTGLVSYLLKFPSSEILENSNMSGQVFETYVVSEIIKSLSNGKAYFSDLYYYRDNTKREIDLVYQNGRTLYPIEIKRSKAPMKDAIKSFDVLKESGLEIGNGLVINNIDEIYPLDSNNYCIPVRYI